MMRLQPQIVVEEFYQVDTDSNHTAILLDKEFKPKGNRLLSIIELWTHSKQGDRSLKSWLTYIHNLVNICRYAADSIDRIIRDVLIIGCNSSHAKDKIIWQGKAVTLNQVIEILQTEDSTNSTLRQFQNLPKWSETTHATDKLCFIWEEQEIQKIHQIQEWFQLSGEQNSSSTDSKRQCFRCGLQFNRKHQEECKAKCYIRIDLHFSKLKGTT